MSCWSWPSWQWAAGNPWGHVGQARKLDAVLLLSWQGPFSPSSSGNRPAAKPSRLPLSSAGPQISRKQEMRERERERPSVAHSQSCQSLHPLPLLPFRFNRQSPAPPCAPYPPTYTPPHTRTHAHTPCANPCPYSPQCLLHYRLQCFSAPQPYAQRWGPPVTQHHTNYLIKN